MTDRGRAMWALTFALAALMPFGAWFSWQLRHRQDFPWGYYPISTPVQFGVMAVLGWSVLRSLRSSANFWVKWPMVLLGFGLLSLALIAVQAVLEKALFGTTLESSGLTPIWGFAWGGMLFVETEAKKS